MKQLSAPLVSIVVSVLAGACGGNAATSADAAPPDGPALPARAVIVAGDFATTGVLSTFDPVTREVKTNIGPAMAVGSDPMLRHWGNELFIINRAENNITVLDDQTLALSEQLATGADTNPRDVAVVGNKLYVPTYKTKGVTVLTRGSATTKVIDLSADAPGGTPGCNSAYTVGTDVYVSCTLAQDAPTTVRGKVYVIDSKTDTVKPAQTITLVNQNPFGLFEQVPAGAPHGGDLVMATVNDFVAPGCLERFTPGASASSCWLTTQDLMGYASRTTFQFMADAQVTFFAVAAKPPEVDLLAYDMASDLLWAGVLNPTTEVVGDVAVCPSGDTVVYDGAAAASGLRLYNSGVEMTKAALPIGIANGKFSTHGLICY
jgi:Lactonase, 7-bladed beta-propeller